MIFNSLSYPMIQGRSPSHLTRTMMISIHQ